MGKQKSKIKTDYPGFYTSSRYPDMAANDKGEILRLKDCHIKTNTIRNKPFNKAGETTLGSLTTKGYLFVRTYDAKTKTRMKVYCHRIVAESLISPCPKNKPYVNHLNKDTQDNRLVNLDWSSVAENTAHGLEHYNDDVDIPAYLMW